MTLFQLASIVGFVVAFAVGCDYSIGKVADVIRRRRAVRVLRRIGMEIDAQRWTTERQRQQLDRQWVRETFSQLR